MNDKIKPLFLTLYTILLIFAVWLFYEDVVHADGYYDNELIAGHATAYTVSGKTASGEYTRPGVAAAKRSWIGKTVILYQRLPDDSVGDMIGIYEILDTGGTKGIKGGKVIDIWEPSGEAAQEFMNRVYEDGCQGRIYFQLVDAEG